ncbi:hypothetical protein ACRAWF_18840 [Streptomyces sp. L7]
MRTLGGSWCSTLPLAVRRAAQALAALDERDGPRHPSPCRGACGWLVVPVGRWRYRGWARSAARSRRSSAGERRTGRQWRQRSRLAAVMSSPCDSRVGVDLPVGADHREAWASRGEHVPGQGAVQGVDEAERAKCRSRPSWRTPGAAQQELQGTCSMECRRPLAPGAASSPVSEGNGEVAVEDPALAGHSRSRRSAPRAASTIAVRVLLRLLPRRVRLG